MIAPKTASSASIRARNPPFRSRLPLYPPALSADKLGQ